MPLKIADRAHTKLYSYKSFANENETVNLQGVSMFVEGEATN